VLADDEVSRILVIAAHPDDVDFGAAGSVARWSAAGATVTYCIVTDGSAGSPDPDRDHGELVARRRAEQTAAAARVGVTELTFLGYPDGRLVPSLELRRDLAREIRRTRPVRVVAPSPERDYARVRASHPDHLAAGEASMAAVYPDARTPLVHPELLAEGHEPWSVTEMLLMASPVTDVVVDITDTFDTKIAALQHHRSQIADPEGLAGFVRGWAETVAATHGLAAGRLAEAFRFVATA
jgi:LmbE family N-acetylglucosaminyl deacetylase